MTAVQHIYYVKMAVLYLTLKGVHISLLPLCQAFPTISAFLKHPECPDIGGKLAAA